MSRYSPSNAPRGVTQRSSVTNGRDLLPGIDHRSSVARRYRDLVELLSRTVMGGPLTEADMLLVRNAASAQLHVEDLTARTCRGELVDPESITRAVNGANRALARLQKGRQSAKASASAVSDYLARRSSEGAQ